MKAPTSFRLYASGENGYRYCVTNNPELAEKELKKDHRIVEYATETMTDDLSEIMYFDEDGNIVPLEKLLAPDHNYK